MAELDKFDTFAAEATDYLARADRNFAEAMTALRELLAMHKAGTHTDRVTKDGERIFLYQCGCEVGENRWLNQCEIGKRLVPINNAFETFHNGIDRRFYDRTI